ncbi:MAG TPA: carbamoyltransferase HypF [Kiritimatiellia bacterium]|nr:carbamoyltransferase HypF [Kiritimatiellia bacterium]HMP00266.1 carbamoyltransferase HypF [Kiritimatiellia bacterium]HMP97506.1 carbamoyltransferase HypF [Kiritimatiellia bacterium]
MNLVKKLEVTGVVQGVGFRPFVYRLASERGLHGWVANTAKGAEILACGNEEAIADFERVLCRELPPPARVDHIAGTRTDDAPPPGFFIRESSPGGERVATITPDLATCPKCLREIRDPGNRRHRYPFTNCTACGPRYSIMTGLPYDRPRTTMVGFQQCPHCRAEYEDPGDRRFHAQPNACPVCGPQLVWWDHNGRELAHAEDALSAAAEALRLGAIVAVKGVGGFHLMVDAANDSAVRTLRARKHREEKPLAVMAVNLDGAYALADISREEARWLTSAVAPIVLLRKKTSGLSPAIAPHNPRIGLLLPYTPLHHLLMADVNRPLVATSGNLSDEPLCIDEREALTRLAGIADFFLVHNRPIAHPVDDSVMQIVLGRPLILRAGRGWAPLGFTLPEGPTVFAFGPQMKGTVALAYRNRLVISPHIGDLGNMETATAHGRALAMLGKLHDVEPEGIACDLHPGYDTTRMAEQQTSRPFRIQHHHAHVLSVMLEHHLTQPVLGVVWDGTGYGPDGTIWGGEFLIADAGGYRRAAHLRPFPLPGGDAAVREPRRAALGLCAAAGIPEHALPAFSTREGEVLVQAIARGVHAVMTTSAGRLFDAVASLLGLVHTSRHEGQAAMRLQAEAEACDHDGSSYPFPLRGNLLDWQLLLEGVIHDHKHGITVPVIAARFHQSLIQGILAVVAANPDLPVVVTGGCFQNSWLLQHTVEALRASGREVYWPEKLPPNDGAIAAGQAIAARASLGT